MCWEGRRQSNDRQKTFNEIAATMSMGNKKLKEMGEVKKEKGKKKEGGWVEAANPWKNVVDRMCCLEGTTANFLKLKIGDRPCEPACVTVHS